jgi:hypothetical protein
MSTDGGKSRRGRGELTPQKNGSERENSHNLEPRMAYAVGENTTDHLTANDRQANDARDGAEVYHVSSIVQHGALCRPWRRQLGLSG